MSRDKAARKGRIHWHRAVEARRSYDWFLTRCVSLVPNGVAQMDGGAANEALTEAVEKVERLKRQASAAPTSPTGWAGVGDYPVKRLDSMSPHNSTLMADSLLSGKKVAHLMNAEPKLSPFNLMNGQPFQG